MAAEAFEIDFTRDGRTYKTFVKAFGDPTSAYKSSKVPLILLHGGPGIPSPYLSPHEKLYSRHNIPLIFYDQIGCGRSSHPHMEGDGIGDPSVFYTVEFFMDELENVLSHFGLLKEGRQFDLLGHSWGGMLEVDYAATRIPLNMRRLVIIDTPASMELWEASMNELLSRDDDQHKQIRDGLENRTPDDPEYQKWMMKFYELHILQPRSMPNNQWPPDVMDSFQAMLKDPIVTDTMWGPSEFDVIGTLKTWSVIEKLGNIKVPALLISGVEDEAQDICVAPFQKGIGEDLVKWITFLKKVAICRSGKRRMRTSN